MPFELLIALRYLLAKRKQVFISVISAISTLGVVVGVMILLIALAIMTGFQGELRSRILGAVSHLSVYSVSGGGFRDYRDVVETLAGIDGIEGAAPVIYGKALASSATGSGLVTLKGVDPVARSRSHRVCGQDDFRKFAGPDPRVGWKRPVAHHGHRSGVGFHVGLYRR